MGWFEMHMRLRLLCAVQVDVELYLFVIDAATPELARVARRAAFADTPPGAQSKRRGK